MSFGLFFLGEYLAILLVSALAVTLFFGGWLGPWLPGPIWFGLKTGVIAAMFVWIRADDAAAALRPDGHLGLEGRAAAGAGSIC